jgi:hypothetical protein
MDQPFVLQFRSLGADYTMTIYPDLRLTVCLRDDPIPVVDLVALPSGIESLMVNFSADQRTFVADLCMRAFRRGYDQGRQERKVSNDRIEDARLPTPADAGRPTS